MTALVETSQGGIKLSGTLVFSNVSAVWDKSLIILNASVSSKENDALMFDCSEVTHIDSAGIALLIEWKKWCRQNQSECHFLGLQNQATTLIKTYQLDTLLG